MHQGHVYQSSSIDLIRTFHLPSSIAPSAVHIDVLKYCRCTRDASNCRRSLRQPVDSPRDLVFLPLRYLHIAFLVTHSIVPSRGPDVLTFIPYLYHKKCLTRDRVSRSYGEGLGATEYVTPLGLQAELTFLKASSKFVKSWSRNQHNGVESQGVFGTFAQVLSSRADGLRPVAHLR